MSDYKMGDLLTLKQLLDLAKDKRSDVKVRFIRYMGKDKASVQYESLVLVVDLKKLEKIDA